MGQELKRWRKKKQWTQLQLAEQLGVSESFISMLEAGKRKPAASIIAKLLKLDSKGVQPYLLSLG